MILKFLEMNLLHFKITGPKNEVYKKQIALGKKLLQPLDSKKS